MPEEVLLLIPLSLISLGRVDKSVICFNLHKLVTFAITILYYNINSLLNLAFNPITLQVNLYKKEGIPYFQEQLMTSIFSLSVRKI